MKPERITIAEGGGGKSALKLVEEIFLKAYGNSILNKLEDSAELTIKEKRLAFTTDSYTIKPIFFPGGDIGKLAVCGTLNDLSVKGAKPLALSSAFIIEEGFLKEDLKKIVRSMRKTAANLGVSIVAGDTKVVSRGEADGIFINTAGLGTILPGMNISASQAKKGDDILISGTIAEHGIAILNAREQLEFTPPVLSDVEAIFPAIEKLAKFGADIHVMRDPTRGGVATVLNEIARASQVTVQLEEDKIPLKDNVKSCCELLGMDPLYMANEGKFLLFVNPKASKKIVSALKKLKLTQDCTVIGQVTSGKYKRSSPPVWVKTSLGSQRFLPLSEGEQLPRIC